MTNGKAMILCLIDDHADEICKDLEKSGLNKSVCETHTATNFSDGIELVHEKKPDIAIVDLHLPRSVDMLRCTDPEIGREMVDEIVHFNDIHGFHIKILVITFYKDDLYWISHSGVKVIIKNGKLTYVNQLAKDVDELLEHLKKKYGPYGFYNRYLEISYEGVNKFDGEKEDLLRKLFSNAKSIIVFPLSPGASGADVFCVEWIDPKTQTFGRPCLVKTSREKEIVDIEVRKFYAFVRGILNREYYLEITKPAPSHKIYHTENYAGFVSSFGELTDSKQVMEFKRFYMHEKTEVDAIKLQLGILFNDVLKRWGKLDENVLNIADYYKNLSCSLSGKRYFDITKANAGYKKFCSISKLDAKAESFKFPIGDGKLDVYNPSFMWDKIKEIPRMHVYKKICHGDLNGRNILISPRTRRVWLIDYLWVDRYHALFDTARLETYIKFEVSNRYSLPEYLRLENTLISQNSLKENIKSPFKNKSLAKIFETIMAVRNYSASLAYQESIIEYLFSLFFHTIQCYTLEDLTPWQKEYILVSSSLIFQRLEDKGYEHRK